MWHDSLPSVKALSVRATIHLANAKRIAGAPSLPKQKSTMHSAQLFDWSDLPHFLAVARHGSTVAAAKALRVSQSTVHRRIKELEARLGRHIVVRHASGYRLTEFGA